CSSDLAPSRSTTASWRARSSRWRPAGTARRCIPSPPRASAKKTRPRADPSRRTGAVPMLEQPVSMADARVAWDQHADRWLVRRGERAWLARRWSWGERRRLLAWAAPSGLLDAERFVAGLLDLLVTALPAAGHESDAAAANPGE